MYKRWPKTVRQLLYPSWSLHAIAKNLYTAITIVDPLTEAGAAILTQINMIYSQTYPIRFGVTISCKAGLGVDVCTLFHHARESYSPVAAIQFLFSLAEAVEETSEGSGGSGLTKDRIVEIFSATLVSSDGSKRSKAYLSEATAVLSSPPSVEAEQYMANCTEYISSRGFPINSFSLNGIVTTSTDLGMNLHLRQKCKLLITYLLCFYLKAP